MTYRWISFDFCVLQCEREEELTAQTEEFWKNLGVDTVVTVSFYPSMRRQRLLPGSKIRLQSFPLLSYPSITPWETKQLLQLLSYESGWGRKLAFRFEHPESEATFLSAVLESNKWSKELPPARLPSCTRCKVGGCRTDLVCYGADYTESLELYEEGEILSPAKRKGRKASELSEQDDNRIACTPDDFQYVDLSWGNCGCSKTDHDRDAFLLPDVRFYFRYEDLAALEQAAFDGFHPVKIKDRLSLGKYCLVCVIPVQYADSIRGKLSEEWRRRVVYIDSKQSVTYQDWTQYAYEAARSKLLEDGYELFRRED